MSTARHSDRDSRIWSLVMQQLEWDPTVDAFEIGVTSRDGAVTLTGFANTYAEKLAAERAAKRVHGVRAVANDIEVRLKLGRTDSDIAADASVALRVHGAIPEGVQAAVHHGHVSLTGTVAWLYQKTLAERAVANVRGVRHVNNYITVTPRSGERDVRRRIVNALHRIADVEASRVDVQVGDGVVRLAGTVRTWAERDAAAQAAAAAPGVVMVDNQLVVEPDPNRASDVGEIC